MINTHEINLTRITDGIALPGTSATTVDLETSIIRYFFFTATSIDYSTSKMSLEYDNNNGWVVDAALVECTNDPNRETFAIRITVDKFSSTTNEPEQREIHLYGEFFTESRNTSSPYNIYLRFMGCPISESEAGFILSYTTIEDVSGVELNIESAVTKNFNAFSGETGEMVGKIPIGEITSENISELLTNNSEDKMLNIVARKVWNVDDEDYNSYTDSRYVSLGYTKCDGNDSDKNSRIIDTNEIIVLPCGFMNGAFDLLSYEHTYSANDHEGMFIFQEPLEIIGYHTFFFGKHFNCVSSTPSAEDDEFISTTNRYGERVRIPYEAEKRIDNKLNNSKSDQTNQSDVTFGIAVEINSIRTGRYIRVIGNQAFKGLSNLALFDLEGSPVERIGMFAFEGCASLEGLDLPDTIRFIGEGAFKRSGLTTINIPKSLQYIEDETFRGCVNLRYVDFSDCNRLKKISSFAFEGTQVNSISLPDNLESIERDAFRNCSSLVSVEFNTKLKYIAREAFRNCISLTRVELTSTGTVIGNRAFRYAESINEINLPDNTVCERYAFKDGGDNANVIIGNRCKFYNNEDEEEGAFQKFKVRSLLFLATSESDMPIYDDGYTSYPRFGISAKYYDETRMVYLLDLYISREIWDLANNGQPKEEGSFLEWIETNWLGEDELGDVYVKVGETYERYRTKV